MEDVHNISLDGEEYAIDMTLPSVKELADLKRKASIFGSDRTSFRQLSWRGEGVVKSQKPIEAGSSGVPG
jgi:hypothetical protein